DDREPAPHPRRGVGRGERHHRRHGRGDALGRDGDGEVPGSGGAVHGADRAGDRGLARDGRGPALRHAHHHQLRRPHPHRARRGGRHGGGRAPPAGPRDRDLHQQRLHRARGLVLPAAGPNPGHHGHGAHLQPAGAGVGHHPRPLLGGNLVRGDDGVRALRSGEPRPRLPGRPHGGDGGVPDPRAGDDESAAGRGGV
ncbi:MAG: Pyruvate kinase, partial [uncultured Gemmatimonadetes bacterium]